MSCYFQWVTVVVLAVGFGVPGAAAPTTRSKAKSTPGKNAATARIPGVPDDIPADVRAAIEQRLREQIRERDRRRKAAADDAQKLQRQFAGAPRANGADGIIYLAGIRFLEGNVWPQAEAAFRELLEAFPESIYAHEARLALFDLAFETDLNPEAAGPILSPTIDWTTSVEPARTSGAVVTRLIATQGRDQPLPLQPPGPPVVLRARATQATSSAKSEPQGRQKKSSEKSAQIKSVPDLDHEIEPRPSHAIAGDAHPRAGFLAWLTKDVASARKHFSEAFRLDPSPQCSIRVLASAVIRGTRYVHTPDEAVEGNAPENALIVYADVIQQSLEMYRADRLWTALLAKRSENLSAFQRSYAFFRRAQARFQFLNPLEADPEAILTDYDAARVASPNAPWAAESQLLSGNVAWNQLRDRETAISHWRKLMDEYPASPHAGQAAYFIGIAWELSKEWEQAYAAFDDAKRRFPDSASIKLIDEHLENAAKHLVKEK